MDVQVLIFWSRVIGWPLAGLAGLLLVWAMALWRPRRVRKVCPGAGGLRRWNPVRAVFARPCGYDLTGLPADDEGTVRCPECGTLVPGRLWLKTAARWRPARLGVPVAVLAAAVLCAPMLKTRPWQRLMPTTVLIGVKRVTGTAWMPTRLRRELDKRLDRGELYGWQERWIIPALQRDMRNDDFSYNEWHAVSRLRTMGRRGWAAIERSLQSRDRQERQLAASALRDRTWVRTWKGREVVVEPSDGLLRATAEGLAADGIYWYSGIGDNVYEAFGFLLQFPERAVPLVEEGLFSDDPRQRFLCASLAAHLRRTELYPRALSILASHLANNTLRRDAKFAAATLAMMKTDAVPTLELLKATGDAQQKVVAGLLLVRMEPGARGYADERIILALDGAHWPLEGLSWTTRSAGETSRE